MSAATVGRRRDITCRSMQLRASTADDKSRTVEAVVATENPVTVLDMDSFRVIDEVLVASGAEWADRVPLLDSHSRFNTEDILGSVRDFKVDGPSVVARLNFAESSDVEPRWQKVRGGHITDVSAGYKPIAFTDIAPGESATVEGRNYTAGVRKLRVTTRWRIREVSLVAIGADEAAKIREAMDAPHPERPTTLAGMLEDLIGEQASDDNTREDIIEELAQASGLRAEVVEAILDGGQSPLVRAELEGFAHVLGVDIDSLIAAATEDRIRIHGTG